MKTPFLRFLRNRSAIRTTEFQRWRWWLNPIVTRRFQRDQTAIITVGISHDRRTSVMRSKKSAVTTKSRLLTRTFALDNAIRLMILTHWSSRPAATCPVRSTGKPSTWCCCTSRIRARSAPAFRGRRRSWPACTTASTASVRPRSWCHCSPGPWGVSTRTRTCSVCSDGIRWLLTTSNGPVSNAFFFFFFTILVDAQRREATYRFCGSVLDSWRGGGSIGFTTTIFYFCEDSPGSGIAPIHVRMYSPSEDGWLDAIRNIFCFEILSIFWAMIQKRKSRKFRN